MSTPASENYYMPPEWHPHTRCWMAYPCHPDSWRFGLEVARAAFVRVAHAIARFEPVTVVVPPEEMPHARELFGDKIELLALPLSDSWTRDTAPTFVIDGKGNIAGVDWQFNAWGGNYADYHADAKLAEGILNATQIRRFAAPFILEGGSIHTDGEGTLLTSEECLLNSNRNPHLSREQIEANLRDYLGVQKIVWLGNGLQDDETDGHVDNIACFSKPGTVLAITTNDPEDSNYKALQDNLSRLRAETDAQGRKFEILEIEQPARRDAFGERLAMSYINFYIANGGIVVPVFDDPMDEVALETLRKAFPNHEVVGVNGMDIIYGGGCIHCITQQQPTP